jgi:hypothetical protein
MTLFITDNVHLTSSSVSLWAYGFTRKGKWPKYDWIGETFYCVFYAAAPTEFGLINWRKSSAKWFFVMCQTRWKTIRRCECQYSSVGIGSAVTNKIHEKRTCGIPFQENQLCSNQCEFCFSSDTTISIFSVGYTKHWFVKERRVTLHPVSPACRYHANPSLIRQQTYPHPNEHDVFSFTYMMNP